VPLTKTPRLHRRNRGIDASASRLPHRRKEGIWRSWQCWPRWASPDGGSTGRENASAAARVLGPADAGGAAADHADTKHRSWPLVAGRSIAESRVSELW
jgi:hypothetical protein